MTQDSLPTPVEHGWQPAIMLEEEMAQTVSDMARGIGPFTVTHALLANRSRLTSTAEIMAITGQTQRNVARTIMVLQESGWAVQVSENGTDKYMIRGAIRD